jgi:GNAT superfamily N-acetyltransferase
MFVRIEHDPSQGVVAASSYQTTDRIGIAFYDNHGDVVIINWLSTDEPWKRMGVATKILDYVRDYINPHIVLGTQTWNTVAIAFYHHYGFKQIGRVRLEPSSIVLEYLKNGYTLPRKPNGGAKDNKTPSKLFIWGLLGIWYSRLVGFFGNGNWLERRRYLVRLGKIHKYVGSH